MNTKPNVLFILPSFDTPGPRNIRGKNVAKHLSKSFDISIFCYETELRHSEVENVTVYRKPLSYLFRNIFTPELCKPKSNNILNFTFRILRFITRIFARPDAFILQKSKSCDYIQMKHNKIDIIVASMFPFSSGSLGLELKNKYFPIAKLILDIGDPLSNNSALAKNDAYFFGFEKNLLQQADHIIVTNKDTKIFYESTFEITSDKLSVIPQGVNEQFFNKAPSVVKQKNAYVSMMYAGSFYQKLRDPSKLIEILKTTDVKNKVLLHVYGGNINSFSKDEIENIHNHKRLSNLDLIAKYQEADILLFFDNAYGIQTSGKIYELMALKKPILFIYDNPESKLLNEFRNFPNVILCRNTKKELADTLSTLPSKIKDLPSTDFDVDLFSWKNRSKLFKKLFSS